ncbi:MAG: DUF998 domain-containing protein [Sulfolobales archaeon]
MSNSKCYITAISGYLIPLVFIFIAATVSGWFSLVDNALSDLGHATKSNVSVVFNLGLSLGSFFIIIFSLTYSIKFNRLITMLLILSGFFLNLIAIFDEVYGRLHFIVSVAFFTSLAALIVGYSVTYRSYLISPVALLVGVLPWATHYLYNIPKGVAVPELISIFVALPFYMKYVRKSCKERLSLGG